MQIGRKAVFDPSLSLLVPLTWPTLRSKSYSIYPQVRPFGDGMLTCSFSSTPVVAVPS